MIGKTLGHYQIIAKLGEGGMGEVYRAFDEHLQRDVAVKILPAGTLSDEGARKRFRNEALALAKLNHANIASVYDFDTQNGVDFLVMEYVPGKTLRAKVDCRPTAGEGNKAEAARTLNTAITQAQKTGFVTLEFDARLALGILKIRSGNRADGLAALANLEKDAKSRGFRLISRKASAARKARPP